MGSCCIEQVALERQHLSCMYLPHHDTKTSTHVKEPVYIISYYNYQHYRQYRILVGNYVNGFFDGSWSHDELSTRRTGPGLISPEQPVQCSMSPCSLSNLQSGLQPKRDPGFWYMAHQDWLLVTLHSVQILPCGVAHACAVRSGYITMADANSSACSRHCKQQFA